MRSKCSGKVSDCFCGFVGATAEVEGRTVTVGVYERHDA